MTFGLAFIFLGMMLFDKGVINMGNVSEFACDVNILSHVMVHVHVHGVHVHVHVCKQILNHAMVKS